MREPVTEQPASICMECLPGRPHPLGATVEQNGVNFCVFSKNSTAMQVLLFDEPEAPQPSRVVNLDPAKNRTSYYWHVFVPDIGPGQVYAFRTDGPYQPNRGHFFDPHKVLLDPYAKAVCGQGIYDRKAATAKGDNCAVALRGVVVDRRSYDWEGDRPLSVAPGDSIIYEMHVNAFTGHPNSGVSPELRGTYAGIIEKIPYLLELGVTAIELLPVHEFDSQDAPADRPNYWGYSTLSFFAPHASYSSDRSPLGPVNEFRDMVKAMHRAGIQVILDVVYNHTAEGGGDGPTISFRGFENSAYYILEENSSRFANYSGCGNTVNANHSIIRRLILDSLRYWVQQMHVDGFRFDLASVLSRNESGEPMSNAPILWSIESDPVLSGTRIIAEAWDAAGLYQVGSFTGDRFAEWNGPFRDDVRRFVKGDEGVIESLMARIIGSSDLFNKTDSRPSTSINFVTCHDGFTLHDLVSYNTKHNQANGEDNRDGSDNNLSWNCGVEGETDSSRIQKLRSQQIRNFLSILLLSHGTPMLLMGDEIRRTQLGNNNTYCQDSELSWFDWDDLTRNGDVLRFVRRLIRLRRSLQVFSSDHFWSVTSHERTGELSWHGRKLNCPDWRQQSHCLAYSLRPNGSEQILHVMLNASEQAKKFEIPPVAINLQWHKIIDTSLPSPDDFPDAAAAPEVPTPKIETMARSVVVLESRNRKSTPRVD